MKLKNVFKMLAVALLICFSVQVNSYAMDYPEYDGIQYEAAFDGMASVIYNNNGVLVDTYDGSPFKERNTWVKFGDGKLKYEDIVNNQELKEYYEIESKFYINWVDAKEKIDKSKKYDDVKDRHFYDIMRFIIKKNPANKKDVIVILKNTNTGETRKTIVPCGKKKERPLDYGHYVIEKMYQEGVDNKEFEIIPDRSEITLNDHTRTNYDNDIYLTVAENKEYKEEQKRKQEEEKKKKEEEKKKAEEKRQKEEQLKKENEEKQKQYEEKLAQQKLQQEQQKSKRQRITIAVVVASVILIAAGFVLYKKRR
ncbi:MAG: hypothetical protein E7A46_01200 [Finegoldia magna]|uniref:hypothetical protein n=1 Tax=Finegoldia magna TaxID=1260 RepID=UPI002903E00D|nr:hypothetical protein [Finegoldia magna]MDU1010557.1 hypothetical protein [Finegoldia magna]MDU1086728.1 hypothetical protein [Finegoldia magna]